MHEPEQRQEWDSNILSTDVICVETNELSILHITNKGSLGVSKRDFFEKKVKLETKEGSLYYFFSSLPHQDKYRVHSSNDTMRAHIYLGFHKFERIESDLKEDIIKLKATLYLQCDLKVITCSCSN